jgi:iron complex transport system permease protein
MPLFFSCIGVLGIAICSVFVGVADVRIADVLAGDYTSQQVLVLLSSRIPRTIALILAGSGLAVGGLLMQMLTMNRFVEPSTVGTVESAILGILLITLFVPDVSVMERMLAASVFALGGTGLFVAILQRIPLRSPLLVPLVGLMLVGVISSVSVFIAYKYDMMQSLVAWMHGDFSGILSGRYELLWLASVCVFAAYVMADRFTVASMGHSFTTNLGLNYRQVMFLGLVLVAVITAIVVVTCGVIPFLGLVIPNIVSLRRGDNMRGALPYVAIGGAGLVMLCDILGRLVIYPFEIPIGTIMGVVGSVIFLFILSKENAHAR